MMFEDNDDRAKVPSAGLLYDFKQGRTAAESHRIWSEVFGNEAPSLHQCQRWFQRFRDGDESLEDEEYQRRPQVVDGQELKEAVESDPSQATHELAQRFGCHHLTLVDRLHAVGISNRCGKWVPHQLSDKCKAARVAIAGILIRRTKTSGFYDSIGTSDEKGIHYDSATRKRKWLSSGDVPKRTTKPNINGKKSHGS
ncbi:unnamed protein product [Heligmosomoides polygyrus]|uniref:HTH_48 domain-containing protein n=1 Tax=Heligmosomoides polygyrus TaxID=6339 RepID=A0A183FNM5_HELPZ|nr:unnamed protein product [Heligmosomoides polygyrus]